MWSELIISAIVVTVCIGVYYLVTGKPPGARVIEQDLPIASGLDENQATLMFFYASWCPHCKDADQPWASLKQIVKNEDYTYGGKRISFEEINAETNKGKSALYKINAYPTFKVVTDKKVYEMVGKPTVTNLREFLKKALGDEKVSH